MHKSYGVVLALLVCAVSARADARPPPSAWPQQGRIVANVVHGRSLESTVSGEVPDRKVLVYLPPNYESGLKRYPVVYLLHGIGDTPEYWMEHDGDWNNIKSIMDKGIANQEFGEMIIVMPDEKTKWYGSFYVNSSVTGNWEDFTTKDLVAYIDSHYRTLPDVGSRAIAGHSMGGYGALRLGMVHSDEYSVAYGMSPGLIDWAAEIMPDNPAWAQIAKAKTFDELLAGGRDTIGLVTVAQAFSPNPKRGPFFADLPYDVVDGKVVQSQPAFEEWQKNALANMVALHKADLLKLRGYRFDCGYDDEFRFIPPIARALSQVLTVYGVDHTFEEYNGDHQNRLWGPEGRIRTELLPYLWRLMDHESKGR